MESPPAIGLADPAPVPNAVSVAPEGSASGKPILFQNSPAIGLADPAAAPGPVSIASAGCAGANPALRQSAPTEIDLAPAETTSFQSTVEPRYDGRAVDLITATLILLFVLPLMCLCALAVVATSRGPIFYRQKRIGRGGELFDCLKFRTMVDHADSSMDQILQASPEAKAQWQAVQKLKHDPRVTPVGLFMRRYCLDELPQLFNVLAGEMSMVGPRPIVPAERERFGLNFAAYCSVRPGLTGIWQISGRHALSYDERVVLDARYARSKCLSLDLLILWKTVPIVLLGENE